MQAISFRCPLSPRIEPRLPWLTVLACLLAGGVAGAQSSRNFQLAQDPDVQELLRAVAAYQASTSDGQSADPAYLIESLSRLEARLAADPTAPEAVRLSLPLLLFRINQNQRAVDLVEKYLEANPDSLQTTLLAAFGYLRIEQYARAEQQASRAAAIEPASSYAWYLIGMSQLGTNRFEDAARSFSRSISLDSGFGDAYLQLGLLHSRGPETLGSALDILQQAVALGLERPEVYTAIGSVLIKVGDFETAVSRLREAIRIDPSAREAYYLLGDAYRKLRQPEAAAEVLQKFSALEGAATRRAAIEAEGRSYFERGIELLRSSENRLSEAHMQFRKAIEVFPGLSTGHYRMAQIELLQRRFPEAVTSIRRAIELNPLNAEFHFILARALDLSGLPGAEESIRRAITLDPGIADFHNLLGNLLIGRGDFQGAVGAFKTATLLDSANPAFQLNLSVALEKTGDLAESRRVKERYLELVKERRP